MHPGGDNREFLGDGGYLATQCTFAKLTFAARDRPDNHIALSNFADEHPSEDIFDLG